MRLPLTFIFVAFMFSCNPNRGKEQRSTMPSQQAGTGTSPDAVHKVTATASDQPVKGPAFEFEETDFNFGTVNEGEMVDHNFKFTNTGNEPLIISRATASCGCTVPDPPKAAILPGQSSEIHVRFNSHNKQNQQVKTITIEANTTPAITKLQIHGFVVPKTQKESSY